MRMSLALLVPGNRTNAQQGRQEVRVVAVPGVPALSARENSRRRPVA